MQVSRLWCNVILSLHTFRTYFLQPQVQMLPYMSTIIIIIIIIIILYTQMYTGLANGFKNNLICVLEIRKLNSQMSGARLALIVLPKCTSQILSVETL